MATQGAGSRRRQRDLIFRLLLLVVPFVLGLVGLFGGVELGERIGEPRSPATNVYYAMSLFVLGGVDLGVPTGSPTFTYVCLWTAYLSAPLVTAGVVAETAIRVLRGRGRRTRRLRDHIVVCGAGRLTMLYVAKLRAEDPQVPMVVIERDPDNPRLRELEDAHRAQIVIGDMTSDKVLDAVAFEHARRLMLLTNDDFANLDTAARAVERTPELRGRVIAHVADLGFMRAIPPETFTKGFEVFNSHEAAAIHLVEQRLVARFAETEHRDLVVLAGFGRFGQTVLHHLRDHADDAFGTVVLLDLDADVNAERFAKKPGFGDHPHHVVSANLLHPDAWAEIEVLIAASSGPPVIVVGTGDEGTNLHTALDLRRRYPDAHLTVRTFGHSPFVKLVAAETGIQPVDLAELISASMPQRWLLDP